MLIHDFVDAAYKARQPRTLYNIWCAVSTGKHCKESPFVDEESRFYTMSIFGIGTEPGSCRFGAAQLAQPGRSNSCNYFSLELNSRYLRRRFFQPFLLYNLWLALIRSFLSDGWLSLSDFGKKIRNQLDREGPSFRNTAKSSSLSS